MDWLASFVTWLVIWLATPLLLAAFWWRSMPAHDGRLTLAIGAALLLSLFATLCGWRRARRRLGNPGLGDTRLFWRRPGRLGGLRRGIASLGVLALWLGMLSALPVVASVSLVGAGWHHLPAPVDSYVSSLWHEHARGRWRAIPEDVRRRWLSNHRQDPPLVVASLPGAEIARRPTDWLGRDSAERRFKVTWCRDRQIPPDACESPAEPYHTVAREEWCDDRPIEDCAAEFRRLEAAFDAEWQEQRHEYLANLTRPNLAGRDLRGANAAGAFLAGIDLSRALLDGAELSGAQLEGADLSKAQLEQVFLYEARLEGANLSEVQVDPWANLSETRLDRANLSRARLEGVDLVGARLESANLHGTYLSGARLTWADLSRADLSRADLSRADLRWANLRWANLRRALLKDADLSEARLEGASLREARLQSIEWAGALVVASPAHAADFTDGRNLTQSQLNQVIGDDNTILPLDAETGEQLYVLTCWVEPPLALDHLLEMREPRENEAELRNLWLCPPGVAPNRTGRPADPAPAALSAD